MLLGFIKYGRTTIQIVCMAGNVSGEYLDCYDPVYAENVVVEYMKRYATKRRLGVVTPEKVARIHNGGPNGWKISATDKYWAKVRYL